MIISENKPRNRKTGKKKKNNRRRMDSEKE